MIILRTACAAMLRTAMLAVPAALVADETGDAQNGSRMFAECRHCHEIGPGAEHTTGPHLNMIFGRRAGRLDDYSYSPELESAGLAGLDWDMDSLSSYIENPQAFVPGTAMRYPGLSDARARSDLLAFMRLFSGYPSDLPDLDLTADDHWVDQEILAIEGDSAYGEYLSSECATCHQQDGGDSGIPSILHWPELEFVTAMHAYKDGLRANPVMRLIAARLSNEEIAALAAYYADLDH